MVCNCPPEYVKTIIEGIVTCVKTVSVPALPCNYPCVRETIDGITRCNCGSPPVSNLCGDCGIVNTDKCNCKVTVDAIEVSVKTPISLTDTNYFVDASWTISYDPKLKVWLSFHTWSPTLSMPSYKHFLTIKDNSFWRHNTRTDSFTNYYNVGDLDYSKDMGWEVEYPITTPNAITTIRSIEYTLDVYKYYNSGKDFFHILDENFDRAMLYNSEQTSGLLKLNIKPKNQPSQLLNYPILNFNSIDILFSKEENKFRFNQFYDITRNRHEFTSSSPIIPMWITQPNGYTKVLNSAYVDYYKPALEHKKIRHYGNKIILRKNKSGDKKMILKLTNSKHLNSPR